MSYFRTRFHYSLLASMEIAFVPVLGILSDKFGRKAVLVPGLASAEILSMFVVRTGDSVPLAVVLADTDLGTSKLHQIIQAAVLDLVGHGTKAASAGLTLVINGLIGAASPFLAIWITNNARSFNSVFYSSGILTGASAVGMLLIPLHSLRAEPALPASEVPPCLSHRPLGEEELRLTPPMATLTIQVPSTLCGGEHQALCDISCRLSNRWVAGILC